MNSHPVTAADLNACDREPIHIPGSIQPHGLLLAATPDGVVHHVAGPLHALLGTPPDLHPTDLRPTDPRPTLHALLGPALAARAAALAGSRPGASYIGRLDRPATAATPAVSLDINAYRSAGHLVVELEPADPEDLTASEVLELAEDAAAAFQRAATVRTLCDRAAAVFRTLTGFDRVLVYRFLDGAAGRVVAEAKRDGVGTFLHHHFPATDIPRQARDLYVRNTTRVIADVAAAPAPLLPPPAEPLDLSDSALRSVSPIHIQYLRNMGVGASASVSIVVDGALWGLIACHNETPRLLPSGRRAACRSLAGALARQLRAKEDAEALRQRLRLRSFADDLDRALRASRVLDDGLAQALPDLRRMMNADGAALLTQGALKTDGRLPPQPALRLFADWLLRRENEPVFASASLATPYPLGAAFAETGSGALSVDLSTPGSGEPPCLLLWFRAEHIEQVNWAGNPHKGSDADPNALLTPRASFQTWETQVRGQAPAWTQPELDAAQRLRAAIGELRQARRLVALNRTLTETLLEREKLLRQKDFLMGEVNHRVQNSLQLVGSFLTLQGRKSPSEDVRAALDEAKRRLNAVALVHRRLYSGDQIEVIDAARYVEELCADAVASMGQDWREFLALDLAPVHIRTDQAVTMGLVLTELLINVNKYAYGGAPGPIEVRLKDGTTSFELTVADSGTGTITPGKGFGSRMIAGMVAHLNGELTYANHRPGLVATLAVPKLGPDPAQP